MKRKKILLAAITALALTTGGILYAADHIDSPNATADPAADITDLYVFRAADPNYLVFVANTRGFLTPGVAGTTSTAKFADNTVIEFNIDTNGDAVEDYVIQCKYDLASNKMQVYGPIAPSETGTRSKLEGSVTAETVVTAYGAAAITTGTGTTGIKVFAGPRDDPFFFDLDRYKHILDGTYTGFANPGVDKFAGTNVMSVVVEVPKSLITSPLGKINVWLETIKQF